ncbi:MULTISPECIES: hypothetical protein [Pseudomonas]|uniref:Uncharacterized protein n=1 Tax=Pseudomonas izuensis TaxID=2684212 RepID=A0ABM7RMT8_9PSED|nr:MULTISPECIES: hypothetical protein [Pseudomonas]RKS28778.1 hypothetical protein BJ917_1679 [Pseudomonas sp. WPR_5_2]BCX66984.1 hypothetical protein LAB08_R16080 [Pseudomonas izuensis]
MVISITPSAGNFRASSDNVVSSSARQTYSPLLESLDLAGMDFRADILGTEREIVAGMTRLDRPVSMALRECHDELGETGQVTAGEVRLFIENGEIRSYDDFSARLSEMNRTDNQQTRESRMHSVITAGMELLEGVRGPGLNLLNVTARTGLIVTLTTVLRQLVGYYVEKAIREGDSTDASRVWAVAAITMIGPAMSLMGAIRDECAGAATLQTRLGRVCMASITMGAFIAAQLTGATNTMLSTVIGTNVYTVARDVTNAFFPLQDNAGGATALSTGVTTAAYGAVQFSLEHLNALMPLSGAGRYAAELGYSLGADVIQGVLNGLGAVTDDFIFILCRSWPLLSPSVGLDSAQFDPESLQRSVLEVRAGARLPSREQLANALLNVNASRTSAFQALNHALGAAAVTLALSDLDEGTQGHLLVVGLAMVLMLIYFPFIWSCSQRTDRANAPAQLSENPAP